MKFKNFKGFAGVGLIKFHVFENKLFKISNEI